ncbi:MAG: extracellular solute-binding protein [Oscillospiraceae bacterium]|jgi:putative aldouronate transport system substrate-binding protein|nr:extracellular solute-binding protein [Oscillospiraceae bacterium]
MLCKKVITLLLTATLIVTMMACGTTPSSDAQPSSAADPASGQSSSQAAGSTDAGAVDPEVGVAPMSNANDPITFTMFIRDPGQAPASGNEALAKITELTGVTIKWEFLVGDLAQKLGVMMAGGDYPDLIFAGDSLSKLIEAKALVPLEDKLENYPNLWMQIDNGALLPYMTAEDGHAYSLPSNPQLTNDFTTFRPVFEAQIGFFIQKAVLADAGYPIPKTVDEYFTLIEEYKAKNPEIDGVQTMGFEILMDDWRNWGLRAPVGCLMGFSNQGEVFVDEANGYKVSSYHINDEAKDYYKRLNEAYHNGIVDPATFTKTFDEYIADITTGAVLGFFDQVWNFRNGLNVLKNDGKFERTYVAVPLASPGYTDGYMDEPTGQPDAVNGIAITNNCKDVDRVLEYFDWLMQREVQDWMRWGVEGKDWVYSSNGTDKVLTEAGRAIWLDPAEKRDKTAWCAYNFAPKWHGLYASDGMPCDPEHSADEFLAAMSDYDKEFFGHYNVKFPAGIMSPPVKREKYFPVWAFVLEDGGTPLIVKNQINDLCVKWYPRIIISATEAEFESNWASFVAEYNQLDLETYFGEIERQIAVKMAM